VVSLVCLAAVFYLAKPQLVLQAIRQAEYAWIGLGMAASVAWLAVRAQVWRTLLRDRPTYSQAFFTTAEGYLLNNLLPFRLGEFARTLLMAQKIHVSFWEVFSTVILERLLDIVFSVSLLVIALFLMLNHSLAWVAAAGVVGVVTLVLFVFYLLAQNRTRISGWAKAATARVPRIADRIQKPVTSMVEAFLNGLSVINEPALFLKIILWMLVNLSVALLQYYFFFRAFYPQTTFVYAAISLGVGALAGAVPSLPGAIGVLELIMVTALSTIQIPQSAVLSMSLTMRSLGYLISGTFGTIGLARDGETLSGIYQKARRVAGRMRPSSVSPDGQDGA